MTKERKRRDLIIFAVVLVVLFVLVLLTGKPAEKHETIKEAMRDAVLHESNHVSFFGMSVNPAVYSAFIVTGILLVFAAIIRIFVIPRFKMVPGKLQLMLESWVSYFDSLGKANSPHSNKFLGAFVFMTGSYVFVGTLFELLGVQAITTEGHSISLPAPLADINGAICMGCLSYFVILAGGIVTNKVKGALKTLKDFTLMISMSFRLFGALLSGMLVTELVYYYYSLSFVLPVVVGVMFTLLHALIQAYVLTMLTTIYFGESTEPSKKKESKKQKKIQTEG